MTTRWRCCGMQGKINRIIFFEGDIETTGYFSRQMEKTFLKEGYQTYFFDYEKAAKSASGLLRFIKRGETAVVTFNYHGLCGKNEIVYDEEMGGYIWDTFDIPCINIVVDHPFYYHHFFECLPKRYIHVSIDRNHDRYMQEYFPDIRRGPFLPLGGTGLYEDGNYPKIVDRPMDVVFVGNYEAPENFNVYIERIDDEYTAFYMGVINELKAHPDRLLEDVMKEHILWEIPEATHEELKETMGHIIFLDMYIRFFFRGEAVRILAEAGIRVHVFGSGWEQLVCSAKENIIVGGSLDSLGCLEKISQGKISLNVMPWFKDGAHDRIFNSMLNGAVCVTDSSVYLDEILRDGENAAVYALDELSRLPVIVRGLLDDPDKMQRIADSGYRMAKNGHTWADRSKEVIKILESID